MMLQGSPCHTCAFGDGISGGFFQSQLGNTGNYRIDNFSARFSAAFSVCFRDRFGFCFHRKGHLPPPPVDAPCVSTPLGGKPRNASRPRQTSPGWQPDLSSRPGIPFLLTTWRNRQRSIGLVGQRRVRVEIPLITQRSVAAGSHGEGHGFAGYDVHIDRLNRNGWRLRRLRIAGSARRSFAVDSGPLHRGGGRGA